MRLPIIRTLIVWLKRHSAPGFFKVPLYDIIVFLIYEINGGVLIMRANAIAFSFFLSLFPALLSLLAMFPLLEKYLLTYLPTGEDFESLLANFQNQFQDVIPSGFFETISDVALNPRFGLLSLGFLLAIFFASSGVVMVMDSFDKSYDQTFRQRSAITKRIIAIGLTFLFFALVIISVILVVLGESILSSFFASRELGGLDTFLLNGARWIVVIGLYYLIITLIYRYGASTYQKFKMFSPGASLATVLSLTSSVLFSYFVEQFDTYNKLYGSIGTIIVTMLWIQINAFVLLVGFELNAAIAVNRDLKQSKTRK
ncbi:MAG: YihY/virulence factor BrkB family protein [Saprospiraceae bacterium]|nr:YihY/virulence factor BrkB family protein [Saprospiraceae bacterium]